MTNDEKFTAMNLLLQGIETCGTNCGSCRMNSESATRILDLVGRVPTPGSLCAHGYTVCRICKHDPGPVVVPPGTD